MRGIVELWLGQLFKLAVVWPAWLLTPEACEMLFSRRTLWRLALAVVFALAVVALLQTLPADLALIGAGDVLTYLDVVAIVWIAGAAGVVHDGLKLTRSGLRRLVEAAMAPRRSRRAARRPRRARRKPPSVSDGGGWAGGWSFA